MSLFNDLQGELIENPKQKGSYHRILKTKEKEIKTKKEIAKEMKEKMGEEAYRDWYHKEYYKENKKEIKKRYQEKKREEELLVGELIDEIYADVPKPINRDEYYTQKFRDDDVKSNGYRFAWRSSRLARIKWRDLPKQKTSFRVVRVRGMERGMRDMNEIQNKAYEYLKSHMEEFYDVPLGFQKKQMPYDYPTYMTTKKFEAFVKDGPVNPGHIYIVFDAMRRGKYMVSETYLGRNSFIFGDVVVTQTGKLFRIALENNLPWLTKDTVEEIHSLRMEWRKHKGEVAPPIYIVNDAYLIKVQPNERETLFYIVPT